MTSQSRLDPEQLEALVRAQEREIAQLRAHVAELNTGLMSTAASSETRPVLGSVQTDVVRATGCLSRESPVKHALDGSRALSATFLSTEDWQLSQVEGGKSPIAGSLGAESIVREPQVLRPSDCLSGSEHPSTARGVMEGIEPALACAHEALARGYTKPDDVKIVNDMCKTINPGRYLDIVNAFYRRVVSAVAARSVALRMRDEQLPSSWHEEPWYYLYVQYTGTPTMHSTSDFDGLTAMIPYIRDLGFWNIYLLPHYESPMGDGGYDVSSYETRGDLGGSDGFERFMKAATEAGLRVATDAVFNHTSTEHEWFQKALNGDEVYMGFYVQRNGREKIAEIDRDGDIVCRYRDPDGTITERVCVFPDVDRTHGLWTEVNSKTYQWYRGFYPFQVDLNLQNPSVLDELFGVLGRELNAGVMGKRMDAIAHWIKKPGSSSEGLPETHAIQALFKSFIRHVTPKGIVMPEVVRNVETVAEYAGTSTVVNGCECPSEGDALISFDMQAALRESLFFQTIAPFWKRVFRTPRLPKGSVWINPLDHHDEIYIGFFAPAVRPHVRDYIQKHGGVVFKNGMSAGGRHANCMDEDSARIAMSIFVLYLCPGAPLIYSGLEIGWLQSYHYVDRAMKESHQRFAKLGVYVDERSCFDPRELHRGPIPKSAFDTASESGFLGVDMLRRLNTLRSARASIRTWKIHAVDSGDMGVLAVVRDASPDDSPLLCLANLTSELKDVTMPAWQACERLRIRGSSLASASNVRVKDLLSSSTSVFSNDGECWRFSVSPFACYIFEVAVLGASS